MPCARKKRMPEKEEYISGDAAENAPDEDEWTDDLSWPDSSEMSQEEPENPDSQEWADPEYDELQDDEFPADYFPAEDVLADSLVDAAPAGTSEENSHQATESFYESTQASPPDEHLIPEAPQAMNAADNFQDASGTPETSAACQSTRFLVFAGVELPHHAQKKPASKRKSATGNKSPENRGQKNGKKNRKAQIREDQYRLF